MRSITEDILSWSKDFLEQPNKHINNLPVCPYAKKARTNNKVQIIEHNNSKTLLEEVINQANSFKDTNKQICIVACNDLSIDADELHNYIHALNFVYVPQDIYLMPFHPEDGEEEIDFLQDTHWESDNEFLMVLIQPFEELEKASANLDKIGFYRSWPSDYYEGTVKKRQSYRRLKYARNEKKS